MKKTNCIYLVLACMPLIAAFGAQWRDLDVDNWQGDFGELVQRISRCGQYEDWTKLNDADYQRKAELLVAHGYIPEALLEFERLLERSTAPTKAPLAANIRSRMAQLRSQLANDGHKPAVFNTMLAQLDIPRNKCHITETRLPLIYRQFGREKRLNERPFISQDISPSLSTNYPSLKHCVFYRFWQSKDNVTQAVVVYHSMGPFAVISTDGGKSWNKPLYLGLHRLPDFYYRILGDSKLPLVDGDNLLLEVTVWNRDRSKPGRPLIGYEYHWKKWNRMLRIPIAAISLDSDGDGLTDLFEERILTDPHSKDTDGDQIDDASDNQPLTPFPDKITVQDEVFTAFLGQGMNLFSGLFNLDARLMDLTTSDYKRGHDYLNETGMKHFTEPSSGPIPPMNTTFIVAERDMLTHITGNQRFIVLNDAATDRYQQKFGEEQFPRWAYANLTIIINPDGAKAFAHIASCNRAEDFSLEKKQEVWHIQRLRSAIYD